MTEQGTQKNYKIKELYYTLQGEGFHSGRPAIFIRFTGCNLWSGLEKDRATAKCNFCDTDFFGTDGENGGVYTLEELMARIKEIWPIDGEKFIVLTGGEPMLQVDKDLITAFHKIGCYVAIETNGTKKVPEEMDWVCVSPKPHTEVVQRSGNELKLIYPQELLKPEDFTSWEFDHFYLQAMDGPKIEENLRLTQEYCLDMPLWKMSLQTHKILGIK